MQKGSAQLIAGPLGVGGGVLWGETWVGGGGGGGGGGGERVFVYVWRVLGAAAQGLGSLPCSLRYGGQGLGGGGRRREEHACSCL